MRRKAEFPVCLILAVVTTAGGLVCVAVGLIGQFSGSVLLCLVGGHVLFLALGFALFWYLLNIPWGGGQQEEEHIVLANPRRPQKKENAFLADESVLLTVVKREMWPITNNNNNNNDGNVANNNLVMTETVV
ncbi:Hypp5333 [Branchiostoma lanceolatum]|uniref:Hypp5333 protein n=1 Tax=Branchiostoma lanceolatum TaxID=7740 RepID=A0A8K0AFG1_BRALA|nr:Hypp5333 [Branchiostoma lanceolatum]